MKITIMQMGTAVCLSAVSLLLSCGKAEVKPDEIGAQLKKLSGEWSLSSARKEGVLQSGYENFSVSLIGSAKDESFSYSISGRPSVSPWPSSGSWTFGADSQSQITRDPGAANELSMTYIVFENTLQILFEFDQNGYTTRSESVGGNWILVFNKN